MNSEKIGNETELDVDLGNIKKIIQKYIYLILISTSLSFFVGYLRGKTLPKIWQGQFQIVLNSSDKASSTNNIEASLKSLLGKSTSSTDLSTQLEIMNSPLVLIPTYENILKLNEFKKLDIKEFSFGDIKSNLKSKFKDGTTVLNIKFNNTNKELIPIVLKEISKTYQAFSYRDRQSNLDKGIKFLQTQQNIYKDKLMKSTKELKEFSRENNLSFEVIGDEIIINTEVQRMKSANEIRILEQRISLLKSLDNEEEFIYAAKIYNPNSQILEEIQSIEKSLVVNSLVYAETDKLMILLRDAKANLYESLRRDLLAFLESEKDAKEAEMISAERPIKVLSEYARLIRENKRTNSFLTKFEQIKNEISLELAKAKDPWEIITNPKVFDTPIGPDLKKISFIYTFVGFFGSIILFLIYEIRKGIVLTSSEAKKILNLPNLLDTPPYLDNNNFKEALTLLINSYLGIKNKEELVFLFMGDEDNQTIINFKSTLNNLFKNKITISNNLSEANKYKSQIIVVILGYNNKSELQNLKFNMKMQRLDNTGFIALNNN